MNKYICDKCGGVSYSSSSQALCPYCKEVEKMIKTYAEADNERRMLDGNLNRMHLTKDLTELESMHDWAVKRVDRLYLFYAEELRRRLAIDEKEVKAVCSECDLRDERKFKVSCV